MATETVTKKPDSKTELLRPVDVRALKIALNKLYFYTPQQGKGMDGEADENLFRAIQDFQERYFLPREVLMTPDSVTMKRLEEEINNPINFQLFKGKYIWRTVGDKHVRGHHAIRDGVTFDWNDPPEGGHPGEDYGCRCWAEPTVMMRPKGRYIVRDEKTKEILQIGKPEFKRPTFTKRKYYESKK